MKLYRIYKHGGLEELKLEDAPSPTPGPGQVLIRQKALGVNFSDVQARIGGSIYSDMPLPRTPGTEGVGEVVALGEGVKRLKLGDLVAYPDQIGGYAEERVLDENLLVHVPPGVSAEEAAAVITCGMTAHILAYKVRPGWGPEHQALVHAGAGAVSLLLIQMLKNLGLRVLTTVSTEEKARAAKAAGADEAILYTRDDFAAEVGRLTDGRKLDVVFDGIGKTTFEKSLDCLRHRGWLIMFGEASGPPPMFAPQQLGRRGSLILTRMLMNYYVETLEDRIEISDAVFKMVAAGKLKTPFCTPYPFERAADAQAALQGRETMGKMILTF